MEPNQYAMDEQMLEMVDDRTLEMFEYICNSLKVGNQCMKAAKLGMISKILQIKRSLQFYPHFTDNLIQCQSANT